MVIYYQINLFLCDCHHRLGGDRRLTGWKTQIVPISKLVLTGERHYTTNDVRQAILSLGQPGTFMNTGWISSSNKLNGCHGQVSPFKQWPDELKNPSGRVCSHPLEWYFFLDKEGRVFSPPIRENQRKLSLLWPMAKPENGVVRLCLNEITFLLVTWIVKSQRNVCPPDGN